MDGRFVLEGIKRGVVNALNRKTHAENGIHFLTTATESPDGNYYGFQVGSAGATITAIDFGDYSSLYTGVATDFEWVAGQTYLLKFKSITISAGSLALLKDQ